MVYTEIKINISDYQKKKIASRKKKFEPKETLTIRLKAGEFLTQEGETLFVTSTQLKNLEKAKAKNKGHDIKLSQAQIKKSGMKGGFLSAILPFLATAARTILPALGIGAVTGLAQEGVKKAIGSALRIPKVGAEYSELKSVIGNGLYLKKGGCTCSLKLKEDKINGSTIITPIDPSLFLHDGVYKIDDGRLVKQGAGFIDVIKRLPIIGDIIKLFTG